MAVGPEDVEVDEFELRREKHRLDLVSYLVDDGMTISHDLDEGGWEVSISVADTHGNIRTHPIFEMDEAGEKLKAVDVRFDGQWWRMVEMERAQDGTLTMSFIDRQRERMARKTEPIVTSRAKATRRAFIIARAKGAGFTSTYAPEINVKKRILTPEEEATHNERKPDADADAKGGKKIGDFESTAYGPPWDGDNGMQGDGKTANGTELRNGQKIHGIAIDTDGPLKMGKHYYIWPNPFEHKGSFVAFDTGSAIQGNRIDFYDWRGRETQLAWGRKTVQVSESPNFASVDEEGDELVAESYTFEVGRLQEGELVKGGERENWWEGVLRLSDETQIQAFVDRGVFICMSEEEMSRAKSVASIRHTDDGVHAIQWNLDNGEAEKVMRIDLQSSRWSFPPGACVVIHDEGIADGRYIVVSKSRSAFNAHTELQVRRPLPELPEPAHELRPGRDDFDQELEDSLGISGGSMRAKIIDIAKSSLTSKTGFNRYSQPGALTGDPTPAAPNRTDCSQWTRAVYLKAGAPDIGVNTWAQRDSGKRTQSPKPGDLMMSADTGHVELYVGGEGENGKNTIGHGSPPIDYAHTDGWPGHYFVTFPFLDDESDRPESSNPGAGQ